MAVDALQAMIAGPNWLRLSSSLDDSVTLPATIVSGHSLLGVSNVTDEIPSNIFRTANACVGEAWIEVQYNASQANPSSALCVLNHNVLTGTPRYRIRKWDVADNSVKSIAPSSTVGTTNSTSTDNDVDDDPFNEDANWATPTTTTTAWDIEVAFNNGSTLVSGAELQTVYVLLKRNGANYPGDPTIELKEGVTVRATATPDIESIFNADAVEGVWAVRFNAGDLADATGTDLSVKVTCPADVTDGYWEIGAVELHVTNSTDVDLDTGWLTIPTPTATGFTPANMEGYGRMIQHQIVHPYLSAGAMTEHDTDRTRIDFDFTTSFVPSTVDVGLLFEGPALAIKTQHLIPGSTKTDYQDDSIIKKTIGGSEFVIAKQPRRKLGLGIQRMEAADVSGDKADYLIRSIKTNPVYLILDPTDNSSLIDKSAFGRGVISRKHRDSDFFGMSIEVTEVV